VINKSDQPGADRLQREIKSMQSLSTRADGWVPPIVHTVATDGQGIGQSLAAIRSFLDFAGGKQREEANWNRRLREMLRDRLLDRFSGFDFETAARDIAARRTDPYTTIDGWIKQILD
jgi:LAO/AO transport system kinase